MDLILQPFQWTWQNEYIWLKKKKNQNLLKVNVWISYQSDSVKPNILASFRAVDVTWVVKM